MDSRCVRQNREKRAIVYALRASREERRSRVCGEKNLVIPEKEEKVLMMGINVKNWRDSRGERIEL